MQYRLQLSGLLAASAAATDASPTVELDNGTFTGIALRNGMSAFLGIPYALSPYVRRVPHVLACFSFGLLLQSWGLSHAHVVA